MDFQLIINRAFTIVKHHPYLWIFGVLGGGSVSFPVSFSTNNWSQLIDMLGNSASAKQIYYGSMVQPPHYNIVAGLEWLVPVGLTILVTALIITFIYFAVVFRVGLISSVVKINRGTTSNFRDGYLEGKKYFWRLFGFSMILLLGILLAIILLGIPMFVAVSMGSAGSALGLGLLFGIGLIFLALGVGLLAELGTRIMVVEDKGIEASIHEALRLIRLQLGKTLLIWLVSLALNIGIGLAMMIGIMLAGLPLMGIGYALFVGTNLVLLLVYAGAVAALFLVLLLGIGGLVGSFMSTFWTLSYLELRRQSS